MANGFLYLVYSEDGQPNTHFTDTLVKSFNSLRETIPDSQTCLYTNILTESNHWIHDDLGFNHVIHDENISKYHIAKANGIKNSPFDKTIYLDVDMIFHLGDKLNDIFDILDTWELAVLHGNYLFSQEAMPDVHTGLLGVRKCDSTDMIMDARIENFNAILPDNEIFSLSISCSGGTCFILCMTMRS